MKYRFLIVKTKKANCESLYQYLTTTVDGNVFPVEVDGADALDAQVEKMLNDDGYAKDDFIVVSVIDYTIDAKNYTGIEEETDTAEPDTGDTP